MQHAIATSWMIIVATVSVAVGRANPVHIERSFIRGENPLNMTTGSRVSMGSGGHRRSNLAAPGAS